MILSVNEEPLRSEMVNAIWTTFLVKQNLNGEEIIIYAVEKHVCNILQQPSSQMNKVVTCSIAWNCQEMILLSLICYYQFQTLFMWGKYYWFLVVVVAINSTIKLVVLSLSLVCHYHKQGLYSFKLFKSHDFPWSFPWLFPWPKV